MSEHVKLTIQKRLTTGNDVRKLRRSGIIPAVIYGKNQESVNVQMPFSDFYIAFKAAGRTHVIDVTVDEKTLPVIIHDYDVDPVRNKLRHVDFLAVNLKEEVVATVPMSYINEAPGVKEFGAIVVTSFEEIEVKALPDNIPDKIEVDLSVLKTLSDVIHISDLPSSDKYTFVEDPEIAVATLSAQSQEVEEVTNSVVTEEVAPVNSATK